MKIPRNGVRAALCRVLVEARARAGLSQRELAARIGRVHSFVAKIENGERRVDVIELILLARALGADPAAMITELEAVSRASGYPARSE